MLRSADLLGAEGEVEWDLPDWWLGEREDDDDEIIGESLAGIEMPDTDVEIPGDDAGGGGSGPEAEEPGAGGNGPGPGAGGAGAGGGGPGDGDTVAVEANVGGGGPGDGDTSAGSGGSGGEDGDEGVHELDLPSKIGHFAFFLAEFSPVLVGKVVATREVEGRKDVQVHWYTPVNNNLRSSAASVAFGDYCNTRVGYAGDFVLVDAPGGALEACPRSRLGERGWGGGLVQT